MARNRVTYQSEALFVSKPNPAAIDEDIEISQLDRVQSANYSFTIGRTDVNQFGQVGRIDSLITEAPTVSLDFSYLLTDGHNEKALGFATDGATQFTKGLFTGANNSWGVSYFVKTSKDGVDAHGDTGETIIQITNAGLTEYSFEASVGAFPTASVSAEAGNIATSAIGAVKNLILDTNGVEVHTASPKDIAASIFEGAGYDDTTNGGEVTALRSSDMVIMIGDGVKASSVLANLPGGAVTTTGGTDDEGYGGLVASTGDAAHIQSFNFSLPLSRTPLQKIGNSTSFARPIDLPANGTLSVSALVSELNASGKLHDLLCEKNQNISIIMRKPGCPGDTVLSPEALIWTFKDAELESESMSSSIGDNKTVDLTYNVGVHGNDETDKGIFLLRLAAGNGGKVVEWKDGS